MDHFAGLDVSVKETSLCIVDDAGRIVREVKVASEPEALLAMLTNPACHFKRIGLEAGPLSQWLFNALAEAGLPVICVETRHMRAALKAQINKTDRNDARGIAQMMRAGLYRPRPRHVRSSPQSRHSSARVARPLCAMIGHKSVRIIAANPTHLRAEIGFAAIPHTGASKPRVRPAQKHPR